ncbi:MAG: caspase family protein, partial [Streptosporangiaceae bacterium]
MEAGGGSRFLLTCAITHYERCAEWDREELRGDVARMVALFCGDFLPEAGRYTHADVLGESPTSVELRDRLRDFCLSADRHPDDHVIVYLTGHGEVLDDGDFVVLTTDTNPSDLLNRTVPAGEIVRLALANTRVRRLLLLLDTCYAGRGGEDMTREALRRIDDPTRRSDDQDETSEGGGVVVVAATRPFQRALPGTFTTYLDRAARSLAAAGNAAPTLRVGSLVGAIRSYKDRPKSQTSVWHQVGMTGDEPSFILNPRYRSELVDVDLLDQERARYDEQRADQLRARFFPATRWFTGRHAALADLASWLGNSAGPHALVVTGQAGSGKTALLGLLAALSDPDRAPTVPRDGLPARFAIPPGAITGAIYAGTMTTSQIRDQIAAAARLRADTTGELIDGLTRPGTGALTVLIDALDEAADPADLVNGLLRPLMQERRCGLRLLLGTRPHLLVARLLGKPEADHYQLMDLDTGQYADPASIRAYIRRILLSEDPLDSAYKPAGLYRTAPAGTLDVVIDAIGEAAGTSFLVARITAATEATTAALPSPGDSDWRRDLPRYAGPAMRRDLSVRLHEEADKAAQLLLPLAYAQGSGLPWEDIWPRLADALSPGYGYGNDDLIRLRRTAGSYAVEGMADGRSVYRLYHQALADHLLEQRDQRADQQAITSTLMSLVPPGEGGARDWLGAHPYIRAHLATHAAQAGCIDDLLTDPAYLLAAGRPQLLATAGAARSKPARAAADAYRRAAHHLRIAPAEQHASYLQLAARCGRAPQLADALEDCRQRGTWSCIWASWRLEPPHRALTGHTGPVRTAAAAELDDRPVVISGSDDRTVRVWDLATGTPVGNPFTGHTGPVRTAAAAELEGRPVVISGSDDCTVRVWDLATGTPVGNPFTGHTDVVNAVTATELEGRPVVISGSDDRTVRVWDLATGTPVGNPFTGHDDVVNAVTATELEGRPVVISGSDDCTARVWDLATGTPVRVWDLAARTPFRVRNLGTNQVYAVTAVELGGRPVVVSGSNDWLVQVWDLATGEPVRHAFTGHTGPVRAVAATKLDGRPVVISGSDDRTVRVWDLATGTPVGDPFTGHTGDVYAMTAAELEGRPVVISGSDDRTVRAWDLATSPLVRDPFTGHDGPVRAVTAAELDG